MARGLGLRHSTKLSMQVHPMCGIFSVTKQLRIKTILSVLVRLYDSAHRQVGLF